MDRESDDEELSLSTQFQQFLDDLSSDEESINSIQDVSPRVRPIYRLTDIFGRYRYIGIGKLDMSIGNIGIG